MRLPKSLRLSFLVLLCTVFFSSPISVQAQLRITIQDAIDSALKRNLNIKRALIAERISLENIKQARREQLPSIYANPQLTTNWGRTLDVSTYNYVTQRVSQLTGSVNTQFTLFQGGLLRKQIVYNKLLLLADESVTEQTKQDLILNTATTFLDILANEDLCRAVERQVVTAQLNIDKTLKEVNSGKKTLADLAQAKAHKAGIEVEQVRVQNQLLSGIFNLKQLMDLPYEEKIELVRPHIENTTLDTLNYRSDEFFKSASVVNAEVRTSQLKKEIAYQAIRVTQSRLFPTLAIFGSAGSNYSDARSLNAGRLRTRDDTIGIVAGTNIPVTTPAYTSITRKYPLIRQLTDNFYQSIGLTLQIPIFNRSTNKISLNKAKLAFQDAELASLSTLKQFHRITEQALAELNSAEKRLVAANESFEAFKLLREVNEKRYNSGLVNTLDYNIALDSFNKAEYELVQAKYGLVFRKKIIDFYLGKPLLL